VIFSKGNNILREAFRAHVHMNSFVLISKNPSYKIRHGMATLYVHTHISSSNNKRKNSLHNAGVKTNKLNKS
jgi:hypothetical protein